MAEHFRSPLTLYVLWHPKFANGERLADRLFNTLSRNVNDPFARTIGIPVYYRSEPAGPGSEAPAPIPLGESDRNAIVVFVDTQMLLSDDWKEYVQALLAAMQKDENSTRVFPIANDFDSFGSEELGATNYIRMFEADNRDEWGPAEAAIDGGDDSEDAASQKLEASLLARNARLRTLEAQLQAREAALAEREKALQPADADNGVAVSVGQPAVQGNGVNINITIHAADSAARSGQPTSVAPTPEPAAESAVVEASDIDVEIDRTKDAAASDPASYQAIRAETILQRRENFLMSKLVHQLCRLLNSLPMETEIGTTVSAKPVNLFLSHAKADGAEIAKQIKKHIEDDSSMKTFFDANDIAAGYEFSSEIKGAIENSALICIQTDYYATREWCLYEVITAKRSSRPVVVLNAVKKREPRSFPYIGNVPTMRWDPNAKSALREVVDMAMLEVLDRSYSDLFQQALRKLYELEGIHSVGHTPELFTILQLREEEKKKGNGAGSADSTKYILYPDPPLGAEEIQLLEDLSPDMRFITPTMLPAVQQQIHSK